MLHEIRGREDPRLLGAIITAGDEEIRAGLESCEAKVRALRAGLDLDVDAVGAFSLLLVARTAGVHLGCIKVLSGSPPRLQL